MSKLTKPSYEELEHRFQSYCKHDGGRTYGGNTSGLCAICGWDTAKCQHRKADSWDKYCRECGEKLNQETAQ
ncbi:hypothetical protein K3688_004188 [Salmonella enterica subsp. enterica serovar Typhimurium]|nr:hypothetical protein [Salmonella enterica subsp. enterica serovar Typhimurium]